MTTPTTPKPTETPAKSTKAAAGTEKTVKSPRSRTAKARKAPAKPGKPATAKAITPEVAGATPNVVKAPKVVVMGAEFRKKELIESVVARSGIKKKDAKPVIEEMLGVLGDALSANREIILPPLGKLRITREKKLNEGRMIVIKMRQKDEEIIPKAQAAE